MKKVQNFFSTIFLLEIKKERRAVRTAKYIMARHNEVYIYGMVIVEPRISKDKDGNYLRGVIPLMLIRGDREIGNQDLINVRFDSPFIISQNPDIISKMEKFKLYDMIEVKGTITTKNIIKSKFCDCGCKASKKGTMTFISPIYMDVREHCEDEQEGRTLLKKRCEISNTITVIGNVTNEPSYYHSDKLSTLQYTLAINRKFFIREDKSASRTDYPIVKEFGKRAEEDHRKIQQGTGLLINGMIQTREYSQKIVCPECEQELEINDVATEIIPYAVEYLNNTITDEEIEEKEKEKTQELKKNIFG